MSPKPHTFVLRGDLRFLVADAWLLPADKGLSISRSWRGSAPDLRLVSLPQDWGHDGARVVKVPGSTPACWVANVGRHGQDASWYAEAARQFVRAASHDLKGKAPTSGRSLPLVALPLVGTGFGGGRSISGDITKAVIEAAAAEATRGHVDVCIVCWESAAYAALQRARGDLVTRERRSSAGWIEQKAPLREAADRLGEHALTGSLVLFLGAGTSKGAGLPSWDELLDRLARRADVPDAQRVALAALEQVDRARIIEGRLRDAGLAVDEEVRRELAADRYPLVQGLAAALPVCEVVTMNYDELFEAASLGAGRPLAVLPWEPARSQDRWLLKMHGCARRGDIVLTRHDYHRYEQTRAALAGIVQALLITRHMLFLGFSLTDPNFHRIIEDVRRAVRREGDDEVREPFGSAVVLRDDPMRSELWRGDLELLSMGPAKMDDADAARMVELLLDRIAWVSSDDTAHLLDPLFAGLLTEPERWLSDHLHELRYQVPAGVEDTKAWRAVQRLLAQLGDR